jgi:monoterpene epsilon-lactone hydrolase
MKTAIKRFFLLSTLLLSLPGAYAQSLPDSTMHKINGFRAFYETLGKSYPPDSTVSVTETAIAGIKSYWFNQSLINQKHIIIYLHRGVYTYGSIGAYRSMLSHLSKSLSSPIVYIEYSLSPEHPFPAANNEILKVYREVQNTYPGYKITIIGDSAGGGLAVSLVRDAQKANLPMPAHVALISPWIDLKVVNKSYDLNEDIPS